MEQYLPEQEQLDEWVTLVTDLGLSVLAALIILLIGFWFAGFVETRLSRLLGRSERMDEMVAGFLSGMAKYAIILITIIAVLERFGVETTSLVAVVGAAGLAIGLALQGTLSNLAAGVMLLLFRPFKVGNFVDVAGHAGVVKDVGLFTTALDTADNVRITIPNSSIWGSSVKNFNHHDTRRVDEVYGIGYGADINQAMAIIRKIVEADTRVMGDPAPHISVFGLGDSSVDIVVRVWVASGDYWAVKFDLLQRVKEAFDAEGVDIPFPTRTIVQAPV